MSSSNTIPKQLQGKGFKKGDPRINRKGRPKSFDAWRELGLMIANETVAAATKKLGAESTKPELAQLTVAEYILRKWAFSNESKLQIAFSEVAFGKVPDNVNVNMSGTIRYENAKESLMLKLNHLSEVSEERNN